MNYVKIFGLSALALSMLAHARYASLEMRSQSDANPYATFLAKARR